MSQFYEILAIRLSSLYYSFSNVVSKPYIIFIKFATTGSPVYNSIKIVYKIVYPKLEFYNSSTYWSKSAAMLPTIKRIGSTIENFITNIINYIRNPFLLAKYSYILNILFYIIL